VPVAEAGVAIQLVRDDLASLNVLEGIGHLTPLEAPSALREAVRRMCDT